jgi:phosphate/sulfate permease
MGMELLLFAVFLLAAAAVFDLMVGVSNDAVNFLNSPIGSRVAPRVAILAVASLGVMAGVSFSSGMMEVARKGIFHPHLFTMPELLTLFLAVMLTDIILLDTFNSFGLPTSTTVSIVFELLGAAVAVSLLKIAQTNGGLAQLPEYINTGKAMMIIFGIMLSVVVAFVFGAVAQVLSRLLFTFDYKARLKRYGALWGGVALASITYFILVKGAKGSSFITPETVEWIRAHTLGILLSIFAVSAVLLQLLLVLRINIFKPIILIGTFALAMAFAANDLVNFIGVPMAGYHAYRVAEASDAPLDVSMEALAGKVPSETYLLLLAGAIMVITLWVSRKARTVTETEVSLGQQTEREERFESVYMSRAIVRMAVGTIETVRRVIPAVLRRRATRRLEPVEAVGGDEEGRPSFDLLRASVNLMVASAVISYATSYKLPLSTTYVTFMVAMGSSFADRAWGRDSAVYRVTGVLTVIGGWFLTALTAFTVSGAFACAIYYLEGYGVLVLVAIVPLVIWRNHVRHSEREKSKEAEKVFNLKKVADPAQTVKVTFEHMAHLLHEIRESLDATLEALFSQNEEALQMERKRTKKIQRWANIITANIFKALRLLRKESADRYAQTARRLQKLADGHRDIVLRSYMHVSNNHKGLLGVQIHELRKVKQIVVDILRDVEEIFEKGQLASFDGVAARDRELKSLAKHLNETQIGRITDRSSKTRLTILFYAIIGNLVMLSKQNVRLLDAFEQTFSATVQEYDYDLD